MYQLIYYKNGKIVNNSVYLPHSERMLLDIIADENRRTGYSYDIEFKYIDIPPASVIYSHRTWNRQYKDWISWYLDQAGIVETIEIN